MCIETHMAERYKTKRNNQKKKAYEPRKNYE